MRNAVIVISLIITVTVGLGAAYLVSTSFARVGSLATAMGNAH